MKIASWNVNSLRVRLPQVLQWLDNQPVDVLGLQETKLTDDAFPTDEFREAGYDVLFSGQKTYNGVALLSRQDTAGSGHDVRTDLTGFADPQRRVLIASYGRLRVANLYVPNGQSVGSEKYEYKLAWLQALRNMLADEYRRHPDIVVMGDFNIAPDDRDVYDPEAWKDSVLCSVPERDALSELLKLGLTDTFRLFDQEQELYSWWDYRAAGFRRNRGLRIDLLLASERLAATCRASVIDREPRTWDRPSDHTPVFAEFETQFTV